MSADQRQVKDFAYQLERISWFTVLVSMLTQLDSQHAFPSYNVVLGFWGVYCAFNKQGRATFGFIMFCFLAIVLDIVFCSVNGAETSSSLFKFCLTMLIFSLLCKLYALYVGAHFFAAIGGAQSMQTSVMGTSNIYDNLSGSVLEESQTAGYYNPPATASSGNLDKSSSSFVSAAEGQP